MVRLYHKDVYFDDNFKIIADEMITSRDVYYSHHVVKRMEEKKISQFTLQTILRYLKRSIKVYELIEVEADNYINKIVIRTRYDYKDDILLVLRNCYCKELNLPYLRLVTCWKNSNDDDHYTLDVDKYYKGDNYDKSN